MIKMYVAQKMKDESGQEFLIKRSKIYTFKVELFERYYRELNKHVYVYNKTHNDKVTLAWNSTAKKDENILVEIYKKIGLAEEVKKL